MNMIKCKPLYEHLMTALWDYFTHPDHQDKETQRLWKTVDAIFRAVFYHPSYGEYK